MTDVVKAIHDARAIVEPDGLGADFDAILAKLKEWVSALELDGLATSALHALYHFVVDELVPKLMEQTPGYVDLLISTVLLPFLRKIHDAYFPHA